MSDRCHDCVTLRRFTNVKTVICDRHALEIAQAQLASKDKRIEELELALRNFNKFCIKPECTCWACQALKGPQDTEESG
jgi:hypothetical protein